ncbi:unnamed protein product [Meganyctiphanes norvegica]|uniref:Uncharacterized protein n=1 Tax=Meganyctiphanes norvegica TaxID=48144 RepID=A0AAV2S077_MEGNR
MLPQLLMCPSMLHKQHTIPSTKLKYNTKPSTKLSSSHNMSLRLKPSTKHSTRHNMYQSTSLRPTPSSPTRLYVLNKDMVIDSTVACILLAFLRTIMLCE